MRIKLGLIEFKNISCEPTTCAKPVFVVQVVPVILISIYTLSDLGVLSNLIGSLSLANEHYSPPTE